MHHPGWTTDVSADLPRKVNTGLGGESAGQVGDESWRRQPEEDGGAATVAAAAAGPASAPAGAPAPIVLPPPPAQPKGPDRFHKEAGGAYGFYVIVAQDHGTQDPDDPVNPGYRSASATASSIVDGYAKAVQLAQGLKAGVRGCLMVMPGVWTEEVALTNPLVDLVGVGRPKILGHVTLNQMTTDFSMSSFDCQSVDNAAAVRVGQRGPFGPPFTGNVYFRDMWFHGPKRGLLAEARCYYDDCVSWADTYDPTLSIAPFEVHASPIAGIPNDTDLSIATNCRFLSYQGLDMSVPGIPAPGVRRPMGLAVMASGKAGGLFTGPYVGGLMLRTGLFQMKPRSGLVLRRSSVEGSLRNEGWVVLHEQCDCYPGLPSLAKSGGTYAAISGWRNADGVTQIPGITQWDQSKVHGGFIAQFFPDALQSGGPSWGGAGYFRGSVHTAGYDGAEASACANLTGTVAEFYHDGQSSTSCAAWTGAGFSSVLPDNITGAGVPDACMFDPFIV